MNGGGTLQHWDAGLVSLVRAQEEKRAETDGGASGGGGGDC